jgi:CheY-like chemotaxis protein
MPDLTATTPVGDLRRVHADPRPCLAIVGGMKTVLVVEDEAAIAAAVAARLRSEGFRVEVAGTGPDGVERCRRLRPALVVLDLMLPGLDGLEVLRRVQRDRPVPVLVLTARDSETDLLVGLGLGADDYMTKPFSARAGRRRPAGARRVPGPWRQPGRPHHPGSSCARSTRASTPWPRRRSSPSRSARRAGSSPRTGTPTWPSASSAACSSRSR